MPTLYKVSVHCESTQTVWKRICRTTQISLQSVSTLQIRQKRIYTSVFTHARLVSCRLLGDRAAIRDSSLDTIDRRRPSTRWSTTTSRRPSYPVSEPELGKATARTSQYDSGQGDFTILWRWENFYVCLLNSAARGIAACTKTAHERWKVHIRLVQRINHHSLVS